MTGVQTCALPILWDKSNRRSDIGVIFGRGLFLDILRGAEFVYWGGMGEISAGQHGGLSLGGCVVSLQSAAKAGYGDCWKFAVMGKMYVQ